MWTSTYSWPLTLPSLPPPAAVCFWLTFFNTLSQIQHNNRTYYNIQSFDIWYKCKWKTIFLKDDYYGKVRTLLKVTNNNKIVMLMLFLCVKYCSLSKQRPWTLLKCLWWWIGKAIYYKFWTSKILIIPFSSTCTTNFIILLQINYIILRGIFRTQSQTYYGAFCENS